MALPASLVVVELGGMRRYIRPVTDMPVTSAGVLGLGFVLGLRHALDVDHLAAVSTIVSQRRSVWRSSLVGALWGLGHTSALLVAAGALILVQARIPPGIARGLELGVALMLIALGIDLLVTVARRSTLHVHAPDAHHHVVRGSRRPFWVGLMRGLAGSAGLTLAVVATIPSRGLALAYVAVFAGGSLGGMIAMTTLLGLPVALAADRFARAEAALRVSAAMASVATGVTLVWQLGIATGA